MNSLFSSGCKTNAEPLTLIKKICDHTSSILAIDTFPDQGVIVSLTYDCYILIWLSRTNGDYFPSISYSLNRVQGKSIFCSAETRSVFVCLDDGRILRLILSKDFNSIALEKFYSINGLDRVNAIHFDKKENILFFSDDSGKFTAINTDTEAIISLQILMPHVKHIQYDSTNKRLFLCDDQSISFLIERNIPNSNFNNISSSNSNKYSIFSNLTTPNIVNITCMTWVEQLNSLFVGDSKGQVFHWRFETNNNFALYSLVGFEDKVAKICYLHSYNSLLTISANGTIGKWDMTKNRRMTPDWQLDDYCSFCNSPFFWNLTMIFTMKKAGRRRHHCRSCGKSICIDCSNRVNRAASLGYEIPCYLCKMCYPQYNPEETFIQYFTTKSKARYISTYLKDSSLITGDYYFPLSLWKLTF